MSDPKIKLKNLSFANFRGSKDLIELDFTKDNQSAVIFGYNGEGKSTFAQTIEWFYRDKIAYLTGKGSEGIEKEDIVNLSSDTGDNPIVSIEFNDKIFNASKSFDRSLQKSKF